MSRFVIRGRIAKDWQRGTFDCRPGVVAAAAAAGDGTPLENWERKRSEPCKVHRTRDKRTQANRRNTHNSQ
jgi:hypothetical protein